LTANERVGRLVRAVRSGDGELVACAFAKARSGIRNRGHAATWLDHLTVHACLGAPCWSSGLMRTGISRCQIAFSVPKVPQGRTVGTEKYIRHRENRD
jgi:hypothetical protein